MRFNDGGTWEIRAVSSADALKSSGRPRCLIVEDDPILSAILEDTLREQGFHCELLAQGGEVVERVRRIPPDIVLLDLVLPDGDGFSLCRALRTFSRVPLIMITGRADEADRLRGLDLGADDYICKPFNAGEVAARVRAVLRRAQDWRQQPAPSPLFIDEASMQARWHDQLLSLTPNEFRLLAALGQRPGHVLSRAQLLDRLSPFDSEASERSIDSHVKNLRRKLKQVAPDVDPIRAVYGVGYRLVPGEEVT